MELMRFIGAMLAMIGLFGMAASVFSRQPLMFFQAANTVLLGFILGLLTNTLGRQNPDKTSAEGGTRTPTSITDTRS